MVTESQDMQPESAGEQQNAGTEIAPDESVREMPSPIDNLSYDWLCILQNKAEAIHAYQKYIRDAEREQSPECVALLRRLYDDDRRHVEEVKQHLLQHLTQGSDETAVSDNVRTESTVRVSAEQGVVSEHGKRVH